MAAVMAPWLKQLAERMDRLEAQLTVGLRAESDAYRGSVVMEAARLGVQVAELMAARAVLEAREVDDAPASRPD